MSAVDPREPQDVREHLDEPRAELSGSDAAVAIDEDLGPDLPNIPFLDASPANPDEVKPTWRGWIHAGTFPLALVAGDRAHLPRRGPVGQVVVRRVRAHLAAAVRQLGAVPPLRLAAAHQGAPEAHRPRQHLPAHRRHLHAARRAGPAAREGLAPAGTRLDGSPARASASGSSGSAPRAGSTFPSTSRSAGRR